MKTLLRLVLSVALLLPTMLLAETSQVTPGIACTFEVESKKGATINEDHPIDVEWVIVGNQECLGLNPPENDQAVLISRVTKLDSYRALLTATRIEIGDFFLPLTAGHFYDSSANPGIPGHIVDCLKLALASKATIYRKSGDGCPRSPGGSTGIPTGGRGSAEMTPYFFIAPGTRARAVVQLEKSRFTR